MKKRINTTLAGFLIGLVGMVIGFFLLGGVWSLYNNIDFSYFINDVFLGTDLFKDEIITVCALFNVLFFFIANKRGYYRTSRGILLAILLAVPFVIYYN